MKRVSFGLVCVVLAVSGCGDDDSAAHGSCSVRSDDAGGGAVIECDDGTHANVTTMPAAATCSVKQGSNGTRIITCSDGTKVEVSDGKDGRNGTNGAPGAKGANGEKGEPGDRGKDGENGAPAPDAGLAHDGRSAYVVGPGLAIEISAVTISSDLHPVVSLSMHDDAGRPLDRSGTLTPGAVSMSFVLAYLQSSGGVVGQYVPYNVASVAGVTVDNVPPVLSSAMQPQSESNGTWAVNDADEGTYTYTFAASLPSGFDKTKTHTLAAYASRTFEDQPYASDPVFNFRPDGKAVTETREVVTTATCNHCHDTLAVHGGSRRDLGLCITCHTEGMQDPESGNSIDFKQMIHKIHRGVNLPSVKVGTAYHIVGYAQKDHDYSDVTFPQAMENCTACHQGGADSDHWKTRFSRAACTSCHDRTNFAATTPAGFTDHTAGPLDNDNDCSGCHHEGRAHIGPYEVDITKVHVPQDQYPLRDESASDDPAGGHSYGDVISAAPELSGTIESVTGVQDGETPVITFTVGMNGAPYDILATAQALSLRFTFAAPTTDYAGYAQYTAQGSGFVGNLAAGASSGEFVWTSGATINDIANAVGAAAGSNPFPRTGTMAVGMEGSINAPATSPHGDHVASVRHAMHNQVFYVALSDAQAVPRRQATVVENCNTCHADLSAHGGSRNDPEYCVMCHSAGRDTITRMPAPAMGLLATTTSLRLSHMVHRIHTGIDGQAPYIAYSPSAAIDFSDVRFPGDRRNCEHCHLPDQYQLPLPAGLLPTRYSDIDSTRTRVKDYYMGPVAAACTGCHDAESTASHAAAMSVIDSSDPSAIAESCDTCHASGKVFGLDTVHARPGL